MCFVQPIYYIDPVHSHETRNVFSTVPLYSEYKMYINNVWYLFQVRASFFCKNDFLQTEI